MGEGGGGTKPLLTKVLSLAAWQARMPWAHSVHSNLFLPSLGQHLSDLGLPFTLSSNLTLPPHMLCPRPLYLPCGFKA